MAPEFADSLNCVIVFTVNPEDKSISWEFVSLELIEKLISTDLIFRRTTISIIAILNFIMLSNNTNFVNYK
jgi:hypothetical protein